MTCGTGIKLFKFMFIAMVHFGEKLLMVTVLEAKVSIDNYGEVFS